MWKAVAFRGAVDKGDSEEVNAARTQLPLGGRATFETFLRSRKSL